MSKQPKFKSNSFMYAFSFGLISGQSTSSCLRFGMVSGAVGRGLPFTPADAGDKVPPATPAHGGVGEKNFRAVFDLQTRVETAADLAHGASVSSIAVRNPEILSGTPVFAGTRVPVKNLTDYLEGGSTIDEFLDDFPSVKREQAIVFLVET